MKQLELKTILCLALMAGFLGVGLTTKDMITSELFSSFSIIIGALSYRYLSNKNQATN